MKGIKSSPENKKEKKVIQNKLKIKEATKEIVVPQPSIKTIMQNNMHKMSSHTVGSNQKKLSHTLKSKLKRGEANLLKWNFEVKDPAI